MLRLHRLGERAADDGGRASSDPLADPALLKEIADEDTLVLRREPRI